MKYLQKDKYLDDFIKHLRENKENFNTESTNYTTKLYSQYETILFNEDGLGNTPLLKLIGLVRKHNQKNIDTDGSLLKSIPAADYFKLFKFDTTKVVDCYKIDISKCYWRTALLKNVITPEIDKYFESCKLKQLLGEDNYRFKRRSDYTKKKMRLIALGSLATTKTYKFYEYGEINDDKTELKTELTKHIYMDIHHHVDEIMKSLAYHFDCYYYYVDCFFAKDKKIVDAIRDLGYDCSVEKTQISMVSWFKTVLIKDLLSEKYYNVRKEDFVNIDNLTREF